MAVRVFLISNYQLAAWGLMRLFETEPKRFELIVSAFDFGPSVVDAVVAAAPDVVLVDIDSGHEPMLKLIDNLHSMAPAAKILLLTRLEDSSVQDRAVISGARGVINKNTSPLTILTAIAKVHEGQLWLDHEATGRIFFKFSQANHDKPNSKPSKGIQGLTEREREIIRFFAKNSNDQGKAIARKLNISESTLRNHLTAIYDKLGVANSHGLLVFALQNGLNQ